MHRFALAPAAGGGFGGGGGRRGGGAPPAKDACTGAVAPQRQAGRPGAGGGGGGGRGGAPTLTPGEYTISMTVDGKTYTQPVTVKPDPRTGLNTANEDVNERR
jgi:hypothetical protein